MGSGQVALHLQQEGTDRRVGGNLGGVPGDLVLPNRLGHVLPRQQHVLKAVGSIGQGELKLRQPGQHLLGVPAVPSLSGHIQPHRPVNGAGIHIQKAQTGRQCLGQRAFPCPGGAVNGNAAKGSHSRSSLLYRAAPSPAARPVHQAIWRLKPPV